MVIYLGADHRGFKLKEYLKDFLKNEGFEIVDLGNDHYDENDDYPDFAKLVAEKVSRGFENSRGIVICGSGVGVDVVVNKFPNVRGALVANPDQAFDSRNDVNANVLALAANFLEEETVKKIVRVWLSTPFSEEPRHQRRLSKISQIESEILERAALKNESSF